jgi:hypothetical protein
MNVLVGCEESGTVREAFAKLGHDAWSCDILPSRIPGNHIQADILTVLDGGWDLAIFHTPCTYLANSGAKHLYINGKKENGRYEPRWAALERDALLFKKCLESDIPKIAMENPIMLRYAMDIIGKKPDQIIQPYMFGHEATKTTCLWLKNLPLLTPTNLVGKGKRHVTKSGKSLPEWYNLPPSDDRSRIRSTTFQGIADAFASQWGKT